MNDAEQFDYIVVGSGAGGGPLASNLAKAGFRVLLMEAGGDQDSLDYSVPGFNGLATEDETYRWDYYVRPRHQQHDHQRRRPMTTTAHFGDAEHPDRLIVNAQIGAS